MTNYQDLDRLHDLKSRGVITEEEFHAQKAKILAGALQPEASSANAGAIDQAYAPPATPLSAPASNQPWGMEVNTFCLLMHFSVFTPFIGFIMTIVMWATCKDQAPMVDRNGKIIFNWLLSLLLYAFISVILFFIFIGIPLLLAVMVCHVVFSIMGAVKASSGITWRYPLSIKFFG